MQTGKLASKVIPKDTDTLLYHFNNDDMESATVSVHILNFDTKPVTIRFGFTMGSDNSNYHPYESKYELGVGESLERTKIVMSLGEKIIARSSSDKTAWRVQGYEENLSMM